MKGRLTLVLAMLLAAASPVRAFLGFGDTSFVTVIANPAEAANWAAELERLNNQLTAATGTLATINQLRAYAGDPRLAAGEAPDLAALSRDLQALAGAGGTAADLSASWQALGAGGQGKAAAGLLAATGAGGTMTVFGQAVARDALLYRNETADTLETAQIRSQIAAEQAARTTLAGQLADAWARFRLATTSSAQQAVLAEISQLQAQDQAMTAHRQALLSDRDLADRQDRDQARVRVQAADEGKLAESALLRGAAAARAQAGEAQRLATVQKAAPAAVSADYSALQLWTTADAGATGP